MTDLLPRLDELERTYDELTDALGDPEVLADAARYTAAAKRHAELAEVVAVYREYRQATDDAAAARELAAEAIGDDREAVRREAEERAGRRRALRERLQVLLRPKDPLDEKNVIMEIRAGAGGDEAGLFAGELY